MLCHRKISFLGGDARSRAMAERMASLGATVTAYGLGEFHKSREIGVASSIQEALFGCEAAILPMPAFDKQGNLYCPLCSASENIDIRTLFTCLDKKIPVFGGRLSQEALAMATMYGISLTDYTTSEEVQIRNAVPTVEGALCLAMQELDITLDGAHVAVLGYGRIGALLAERLLGLGANVTVAVRKLRDVARVEVAHARALHLTDESSVFALSAGYDVIFNTIPAQIIPPQLLLQMPEKTLLIELASAPGGWDASAPVRCRALYAPGLPAKHAPITAGIILADCLVPTLKEVLNS